MGRSKYLSSGYAGGRSSRQVRISAMAMRMDRLTHGKMPDCNKRNALARLLIDSGENPDDATLLRLIAEQSKQSGRS